MCRWACPTVDTTYMCKWCGTRYCKECLHGDFQGLMKEPNKCRICNQPRCQGQRVEYVPRPKTADDKKGSKRSKNASRVKSAKSTKGAKGTKNGGKKSSKKKKKR